MLLSLIKKFKKAIVNQMQYIAVNIVFTNIIVIEKI